MRRKRRSRCNGTADRTVFLLALLLAFVCAHGSLAASPRPREAAPSGTPLDGDVAIRGLEATNDGPTVLGQPTQFTVRVSAGTNISYRWDFADGATATGATVSHTYTQPGTYLARVTASNSQGSATDLTIVEVDVPIEGLSISYEPPVIVGSPVRFQGRVLRGTNIFYGWAFGDGDGGSGPSLTHTYAEPGDYVVSLTAINNLATHMVSTTVEVQDAAIAGLAANNSSPAAPSSVITLTASIDTGTNVDYTWDFGNGASGVGARATHSYTEAGRYTATVTATNSRGTATTTTTVLIDVAIAGLTALSSAPAALGETVVLTASIDAGTNVGYSWDFGDGASGSGPSLEHQYALAGSYTATVTATNSLGAATATTTVQINAPAPPLLVVYVPMVMQ